MARSIKGGLSKEEWLDLDDRTLINVYARPGVFDDNPEKGYWPVPRVNPDDPPSREISYREVFFHPKRLQAMRTLGMKPEEMEEKYREWIKSLGK